MHSRRFRFGGSLLLAVLVIAAAGSPLAAQEERGWLGVSLVCSYCSRQEQDGVVVWSFSSPPVVRQVRAGGPAALAGLEAGDSILAVAGVEITSDEGGRLFGGLQSGVPVAFRVHREGRELTVTVTPASQREAFGEWYAYVAAGNDWDSLRVQLRQLYRQQSRLQRSLQTAERLLVRTNRAAQRSEDETLRRLVQRQRLEMDSIRRELVEAQARLRSQTDQLAARTLYIAPTVPRAEVAVVVPAEPVNLTVYHDAVAGARFTELSEELAAYFPGVSEGLVIVKVVEDTPAHAAGLHEGDVVVAVDGEPVRTVADLRAMLRDKREAELTYFRKGEKRTCKIPPQ